MASDVGRTLKVSPYRRFIADMLHFATQVPSVPVERTMNLAETAAVRMSVRRQRPTWTALFVKGYGLTARDFPELRRAWLTFPYTRIYEHPYSICAVAVERQFQGEHAVLAGLVRAPENQSLVAITQYLRRLKTAPPESIGYFRRVVTTSRWPRPIRRLLWWSTLNWSGYKRAKRLGTCGVSSYGQLGAEQLRPLCPLTSLLTFGPVAADGSVRVRIVYDHRVTDGAQIGRALARLEEIMTGEIVAELRALAAAELSVRRAA